MHPLSQQAAWLHTLGLTPQATEEEIRQAYLNLVQVWHPDRFEAAHLKALAEEKIKEINNAFDGLKSFVSPPADEPLIEESAPVVLPPQSRRWMPLAVVLVTVMIVGGIFSWLAHSGSRTRVREIVPPPIVETIAPAADARPPVPARPAKRPAEVPTQPETGLLEKAQAPFGAGRLIITNDTHLDAYARLMMSAPLKKQVRSIYIRSGESFSVTQLPVGQFTLYAQAGRGWLAGGATFENDIQELEPVGPLAYLQVQGSGGISSDQYTVALSAKAPETVWRTPSFRGGEAK